MKSHSKNKESIDKVKQLYSKRAMLYEQLYVDFLGWGKVLEVFFRKSNYLHPTIKVLDAGCGTGIITRTLYKIAREKIGYEGLEFHAFDLTSTMLDIFRKRIIEEKLINVRLNQADILNLTSLPVDWREYDLIVSSAVLEYIPSDKINIALSNLKQLLKEDGILLLFITRRKFLTIWTGKLWWKTNLFEEDTIQLILRDVGFKNIQFKILPSLWSSYIMVIEARK
jgi:ubiquinone/menaquinone biosynthesis C-methylase UbiE